MLEVGKPAPDFKVVDEAGKSVSLKEFRGQPLVIYFFPRADTPG
jgi:thioredoxin-dependent peroxiredoxin